MYINQIRKSFLSVCPVVRQGFYLFFSLFVCVNVCDIPTDGVINIFYLFVPLSARIFYFFKKKFQTIFPDDSSMISSYLNNKR